MRIVMRTVLTLLALAVWTSALAQVLPREVRARILEAVVELAPYDDDAGRFVGTGGSGTVISPDGYVLTNFHVIGDDRTGHAYTWHAVFTTDPSNPDRATEHRYWARFVAGDARHDLALVKIELLADERPLPPGLAFTAMTIGNSNSLVPGDPITVVGYPGIGGYTVTVTTGIVSGWLGEDLESGGKGWIKTDARIAGGNSGGGAFDEHGLLVAVPTSRLQTHEGAFEEQNLLRPVALALPLIDAHVAHASRAGGVATTLPAPGTTPGASSTVAAPPAPAPGGADVVRGTLTGSDPTLDTGEYLNVVERDLAAGVPVRVRLTSREFDVYLGVLGPNADRVLEVDDTPGFGLDVDETFVPEVSGTYTFVVTSAFPGETGAYELWIETGAATPIDPFGPPAPQGPAGGPAGPAPGAGVRGTAPAVAARAQDPSTGTVGSIPIGGFVTGRLAGSSGATYHTYVVDVPPGTAQVTLVMQADADLDLFVKHGSDIVDWGETGDWDQRDVDVAPFATLILTAPRPGPWYVDVVFLGGGETVANYTFEVR